MMSAMNLPSIGENFRWKIIDDIMESLKLLENEPESDKNPTRIKITKVFDKFPNPINVKLEDTPCLFYSCGASQLDESIITDTNFEGERFYWIIYAVLEELDYSHKKELNDPKGYMKYDWIIIDEMIYVYIDKMPTQVMGDLNDISKWMLRGKSNKNGDEKHILETCTDLIQAIEYVIQIHNEVHGTNENLRKLRLYKHESYQGLLGLGVADRFSTREFLRFEIEIQHQYPIWDESLDPYLNREI